MCVCVYVCACTYVCVHVRLYVYMYVSMLACMSGSPCGLYSIITPSQSWNVIVYVERWTSCIFNRSECISCMYIHCFMLCMHIHIYMFLDMMKPATRSNISMKFRCDVARPRTILYKYITNHMFHLGMT